jgi:hypothetical protein
MQNGENPASDAPEEDRQERFRRVAERRTRAILHTIRLLGNCSNKSAYSYDRNHVDQIFSAIQEQLDAARARFEPKKKEAEFRLK